MNKIILLIALFSTRCATSKETITFYPLSVEPIEAPNIDSATSNPCPLPQTIGNSQKMSDLEIGHFHRRCRAIYGHKDYCMVKYRIIPKVDGSRHIDIICGRRPITNPKAH